jgi:hypothetical protein
MCCGLLVATITLPKGGEASPELPIFEVDFVGRYDLKTGDSFLRMEVRPALPGWDEQHPPALINFQEHAVWRLTTAKMASTDSVALKIIWNT